jgi:hypothetical protein
MNQTAVADQGSAGTFTSRAGVDQPEDGIDAMVRDGILDDLRQIFQAGR